MSTPTKRMKEILAEIGNGYTTQTIDFELCGYKKLKKHDIEISNINNNRTKNVEIIVYVWEISNMRIVERYIARSIPDLKKVLVEIEKIYD